MAVTFSLAASLALAGALAAHGDGSFGVPLRISTGEGSGPVSVAAGDFNRDGKLDLAAVNGTSGVILLLQDPLERSRWILQPPLHLGNACFSLASSDFDGDGNADLLVADPGSIAYFLRSKGDGTFERAVGLQEAEGPREFAIGDWNGDRKLDLATVNLNTPGVSIFLGGGDGTFSFLRSFPVGGFPHAVEAPDYDGDGRADLLAKLKEMGTQPFHSRGDGRFDSQAVVTNLGPRGDISSGDFNGDGKGDLLTNFGVGLSRGDGTFAKTLDFAHPFRPVEAADIDGDGRLDAVVASEDLLSVEVHRGKGDGAFLAPVRVGVAGLSPFDLLVQDLDGDGRRDLISAGNESPELVVFWGKAGSLFLEAGYRFQGWGAAGSLATGDLDGDGWSDLFVASSSEPVVEVHLGPAAGARAPIIVGTAQPCTSLEAVDLDGDGVLDLAGANQKQGLLLATIIDATGQVRSRTALPAGLGPAAVASGRIDEGETVDLAVASTGSSEIAVFSGLGGGAFAEARRFTTVQRPGDLTIGDLDLDGRSDLAVAGDTAVAVHHGESGGTFSGPVVLTPGMARTYGEVSIADLDGDGRLDLAAVVTSAPLILVFRGKEGRAFEAPRNVNPGPRPASLDLADLDGNGLPDLTIGSSAFRSISVVLNQGGLVFAGPVTHRIGFAPLGHRVADLDGNGALDLLTYDSSSATVLFGRSRAAPDRFRRGDADLGGLIDLTDAVRILSRLFLGGEPLSCEDAADSDDNGFLDLSDAVVLLQHLFLGGGPLPPPGTADCGTDPTADLLAECRADC